MMVKDLHGTNSFNKVPEQSQPSILLVKVPSDNIGVEYIIMVKKDIWKEIGGVKTGSEHALKCERPFVKTAALIWQYFECENTTRKDDVEVLLKEIKETVRQL